MQQQAEERAVQAKRRPTATPGGDARAELLKLAVRKIVEEALEARAPR